MMMVKISNFYGFLKDEVIYRENVDFWKQEIEQLNPNFKDWMSNHYVNGLEINDGNPLVAVRYSNIAIRIIQTEKNALQPKFASWIKNYEQFNLKELVVCIQPDKAVYEVTIFLLKLFLKDRHRSFQHKMNIKYNYILNRYRTNFLVNQLEPISASAEIVNSKLELNKDAVKIVRAVSNRLKANESVFRNAKISKPYNISLEKAYKITAEISVHKPIDNKKATKINLDFKNLKNHVEKLKKEIELDHSTHHIH